MENHSVKLGPNPNSRRLRLFSLLRSLWQVNLLFSDYEKNVEKMGKVATVYKYESCPLSFKTLIKSVGWKLSELLALEENPHPHTHHHHHHPQVPVFECSWVALKIEKKKIKMSRNSPAGLGRQVERNVKKLPRRVRPSNSKKCHETTPQG